MAGTYALNSLRLEKSFGIWSREYTPEFAPAQCGLDRFVALDKPADFVGREQAVAAADAAASGVGPRPRQLVTLELGGDVDAWGYEPVWSADGEVVGFTTSGGFGHHVGKSLAMAYVDAEALEGVGGGVSMVHVMGDETEAAVLTEPAFDPSGARMFRS